MHFPTFTFYFDKSPNKIISIFYIKFNIVNNIYSKKFDIMAVKSYNILKFLK